MTANIGERPRISEHAEQSNFIAEVYLQYGRRDDFIETLLFAVPNGSWFGGDRPAAMYQKFKKEGFRKGVADIIYLQPRGDYSCLAIEMKALDRRAKKDAISEEQMEFLKAVKANGGAAAVCFGSDEASSVFAWYMGLPVSNGDKEDG